MSSASFPTIKSRLLLRVDDPILSFDVGSSFRSNHGQNAFVFRVQLSFDLADLYLAIQRQDLELERLAKG